ncbi:hypothetical protein PACTADRAFT_35337 [Pachysolen tannophilus NRRL Y-2460]|uniref:Cation efflux protein transmembrane domain-containing protein n=1 Tax=Pachysolen tannophilus NRRL Y-2460 TaxID=669874 RepID=A0A1E4TP83_PACTA|nr:hypothetical protein PACTADRAFT_35337 [Pachysolen tannophilus NRRL Y-2460]
MIIARSNFSTLSRLSLINYNNVQKNFIGRRFEFQFQFQFEKQFSQYLVLRHSHSHDTDLNSHSHSHSHSHSSSTLDTKSEGGGLKKNRLNTGIPELDNLDLDGEDFEIELNKKKENFWTKTKDFFNPHVPLIDPIKHLYKAKSGKKNDKNGDANNGADASDADHDDDDHHHGHSHTHGAHSVQELKLYDTSEFRSNPGVKITLIGLAVNIAMAATKGVSGVYFHSQALLADAVHSVSDTISDILTLATVNSAAQKPIDAYPFGFGKIETIGSLFVSLILLYAGIQIGWASLLDVLTPLLPHNVMDFFTSLLPAHSHSHVHTTPTTVSTATDVISSGQVQGQSHDHDHDHDNGGANTGIINEVADINAAWIALGSIFVKEWLFRVTKKIGETQNSKVLIANAWHHRVDSLTSFVALVTISAGYYCNIYWLDSVGGLLVSVLIVKVGVSGVVQAWKELIDKAILKDDPRYTDFENKVNVLLMENDRNFLLKDLTLMPSGANLNACLTLNINKYNSSYEKEITIERIGYIISKVKQGLTKEYPNLKKINIEFEGGKNLVESDQK